MTSVETKLPRGLRNHNPLNIRYTGAAWYGLQKKQTDKAFCQFQSDTYGYRAAFIILFGYINKHHLITVDQIISRWAPRSDGNATDQYVQGVIRMMTTCKDSIIDWRNKDQMVDLAEAMCFIENGRNACHQAVVEGYDMAMKAYKEK